ncbi:MAG TPA: glycosyltransferase [Solirubrobacteraceae bacterium]|nr:glycosyltransferase [Solirubrobacteraceae bacterium]
MGPRREPRRPTGDPPEPTALPLRNAKARDGRGRRYLFFSNELIGLGHLRRTLSIANRLAELEPASSSLIVTGSPVVPWFGMPPRVDILKLPGWTRDEQGDRRAGGLALDVSGLHAVRAGIELAVASSFEADVAIVDKLPLGPGAELTQALEALRGFPRCRVVLGLRDIDDAPERVRREWGPDMRAAIERYYDSILVYGPSSAPDAIRSVGWTDLRVPVHHVGYLGWPMSHQPAPDLPVGYLLATVGGGHDGFRLLEGVLEAVALEPLPCPTVMISGPLMAKPQIQRLRRLAAGIDAQVIEFRGDMDRVLAGARAVVGMAGYNTVAEIMRARRPGLLVPRTRPSEEQLVRARTVTEHPSYDMLHPDELSPERMRAALGRLLELPRPAAPPGEFEGADRAARVLSVLADEPRARRHVPHRALRS